MTMPGQTPTCCNFHATGGHPLDRHGADPASLVYGVNPCLPWKSRERFGRPCLRFDLPAVGMLLWVVEDELDTDGLRLYSGHVYQLARAHPGVPKTERRKTVIQTAWLTEKLAEKILLERRANIENALRLLAGRGGSTDGR